MPLTRYQARNEYGLADPDLYQAADKDDPEALLEGVAMAGLVGILRQLGDLAEFAAEMFHDLHEEVMATAARSHGLMARVQQLEPELPFIEKTLLCQTDHSPFFSNKGVEWYPNLQQEQSVITRGDLPRCIMDSYEECRGPPRLFLLDKFDISGAGACLKRYTDPSFVRLERSSYEASWDDIQREKKSQKAKRRSSHWRNGGTPVNALSSHAKLHELFLEEHLEAHHSDPARAVKLKTRKLDGYSLISKSGESYMEKFVQSCVDNKTGYQIITPNPELLTWNMDGARDIVTDIPEISMVDSLKKSYKGTRAEFSLPNEQENVANVNLNGSSIEKDIETVPESNHNEVPGTTITKDSETNFNDKQGFLQHRSYSEDLTSEADKYVDATATMESETETDDECRHKNSSGALENGNHYRYSDVDEERMEDPPQFSFSYSIENIAVSENEQSSVGKQSTSYSYSDTASLSVDDQSDGEKVSGCLPSSSKSDLVDSTSRTQILDHEANKMSHDVQESVNSSNVYDRTSFSSNDTCSSPKPVSQNTGSCSSLAVQSLAPEVLETFPECINFDLIKGDNDGSKVDPIVSSRSSASFDVENSNFPSKTSSISSTSEGSRCDTTIEKNYMVDCSLNSAYSDTSPQVFVDSQTGKQLQVSDNDVETNPTVVCSKGVVNSGSGSKSSAELEMEVSPDLPSKVCSPSKVDEIHLTDTLDDETGCIGVATPVTDIDFQNSVTEINSQGSVAEITNEHSCAFGTTGDVSVSESHEEALENGMSTPAEGDIKLSSDFKSGEKLVEDASPTSRKSEDHISDDGFHDLPRLENVAIDIVPKVELATSDNHAVTSSCDVNHAACMSSTSLVGSLPWISTNTYQSSPEAGEICHDTLVESDRTPAEGLGNSLNNNDLASCESLSPVTSLDQSNEQSKAQTPCASHAFADEELLQSSVSRGLEFAPQSAGIELNSPKQELNLDPTFPSFGLISENTPPNQEDMPPLPPLPPMQWCIGKVRHSYFPTFMESLETSSSASSSAPAIDPSLNVQIGSKPSEQSVSLGSDKSEQLSGEPLQSSNQFLTIGTDLSSISQRTQSANLSAKLPTMPNQESREDLVSEENNRLNDYAAQNHELVYSQESSLQLSQYPSANYEDFKDDTDVHNSQSSRGQHHCLETKALMPTQSTNVEDKGHSVHDSSNAEAADTSVQKIIPCSDAMWPVSAFTIAPTLETNKPEELPIVRLPRPRSPLVDAVAAHDRRTMKKVSERVQPPIKPKQDDTDSLLAQIRNKSINLKPAAATRPNIQTGPKTNLRVAAILEKANTIRQAMAGSDEDEDSDSWSDS